MDTVPNSRSAYFKLWTCLGLIAVSLTFIRSISDQFKLGTTTFDHPYIKFTGALLFAGFIWLYLISILRKFPAVSNKFLGGLLLLSLGLRALFIGSTPIYENDWNRYLWDGAVLESGQNPYRYAPAEIHLALDITDDDLQELSKLSEDNGEFANRINYPELTTIYTPFSQLVFAGAAKFAPFNLDLLRIVFLFIEALTLFLLVKTLTIYKKSNLWAVLYAFNPLLIYTGFNAVHMDILIAPFLLLSVMLIKEKPYHAAISLGLAGGIKLWPLILAPILFRQWKLYPKTYVISALIVMFVFIRSLLPMILSLKENSGLIAYASEWQKSAWLFPVISNGIGLVFSHPDQIARIMVALTITLISLWFGFISLKPNDKNGAFIAYMLGLIVIFFLLSPTGYPWYVIWVLVFLPFYPNYGTALLCVTPCLYYLRYALDERNYASIYESVFIPIQFGAPLLLILAALSIKRARREN